MVYRLVDEQRARGCIACARRRPLQEERQLRYANGRRNLITFWPGANGNALRDIVKRLDGRLNMLMIYNCPQVCFWAMNMAFASWKSWLVQVKEDKTIPTYHWVLFGFVYASI